MGLQEIQKQLATLTDVELICHHTSPLEVPAGEVRRWVVLHDGTCSPELEICVGKGARLELTEIYSVSANHKTHIRQQEESCAEVTLLVTTSADCKLQSDLEGQYAESRVNALFLVGAGEKSQLELHTRHSVSDCRSNSLIKGVAGGEGAEGFFRGMVYVAPDAQRTDAHQTSRNIELTRGARIRTMPQLEIYADDVKCTHGATVGQLDPEAIYYMRQRGLSDKQARRLQIEGFASDVVCHHPNATLAELLCSLVNEKLQNL